MYILWFNIVYLYGKFIGIKVKYNYFGVYYMYLYMLLFKFKK